MLDFLNAFVRRAESAILEADRQLRSAEIKLQILEDKLAVIPDPSSDISEQQNGDREARSHSTEATAVENEAKCKREQTDPDAKLRSQAAVSEIGEAVPCVTNKDENDESTKRVLLVKNDPVFTKYFKMLKLGVVEPAVKLKMQSEGVDPALLDQPNAPSPNTTNTSSLPANIDVIRDHTVSSSVSSFSDSD